MRTSRSLVAACVAATSLAFATSALATGGGGVHPLDILVTNDDGIGAEGIQTLAAVLSAAGHNVTVVAPAEQQSGKGGSINTSVFTTDFIPIVRIAPNQWSVSGTPSDAVNAALNIVMRDDPPDLVVSGLNEGQNLGKPASNTSGTMGAALRAALGAGIPAIAGSVGILFEESQIDPPFPSTAAAYAPAAAFIAEVVDALGSHHTLPPGIGLLPWGVNMLNINFPVPVADWDGVKVTRLGDESDLSLPFFDVTAGFPPFFPPVPVATPCDAVAVGGFCLASVGLVFEEGPDPQPNADTSAYRVNQISVTPMNGDMSSGLLPSLLTRKLLDGVIH